MIEERTGKTLGSGVGQEVVQVVLSAFKTYAHQEAACARYYQDLTEEHDQKKKQVEALRGERDQLAASKDFLHESTTPISVNLLTMSVEDKHELDAELTQTTKTEKSAFSVYLNIIELCDFVISGFRLIVENSPKMKHELKSLLASLEIVRTEFGNGFSGKKEGRAPLPRAMSRRHSGYSELFTTAVDAEREKTYLSLSKQEMTNIYLKVFPGQHSDAISFSETAYLCPIIHFCTSPISLEQYFRQFPVSEAAISTKKELNQLISQGYAVLNTNVGELMKGLAPFLSTLEVEMKSEYRDLVDLVREKVPSRAEEVKNCMDPLYKVKRKVKYTATQKESIERKIGNLLSNQKGAEDYFVLENKYVSEEGGHAKPRKTEEEGREEDFVLQERLEYRLSKTSHGQRKEMMDSCVSPTEPEKKSLSLSLQMGIRNIENRLRLIKIQEKTVQNSAYTQSKVEIQKESPRFLAPFQGSASLSRLDTHSTRPYTQASNRRTYAGKYRIEVDTFKEV